MSAPKTHTPAVVVGLEVRDIGDDEGLLGEERALHEREAKVGERDVLEDELERGVGLDAEDASGVAAGARVVGRIESAAEARTIGREGELGEVDSAAGIERGKAL